MKVRNPTFPAGIAAAWAGRAWESPACPWKAGHNSWFGRHVSPFHPMPDPCFFYGMLQYDIELYSLAQNSWSVDPQESIGFRSFHHVILMSIDVYWCLLMSIGYPAMPCHALPLPCHAPHIGWTRGPHHSSIREGRQDKVPTGRHVQVAAGPWWRIQQWKGIPIG